VLSKLKAILLLGTAFLAGGGAAAGLAVLLAGLPGRVGLGRASLPVGWVLGLALTALVALLLVSPVPLTLKRLGAWLSGRGGLAVRGDGLTVAGLAAALLLLPALGLSRCTTGEEPPAPALAVEEPPAPPPTTEEPPAPPPPVEEEPAPPLDCGTHRREVLAARAQVLGALVGAEVSCANPPQDPIVTESVEVDPRQACRPAGSIEAVFADAHLPCQAGEVDEEVAERWLAMGERLQALPVGVRPISVVVTGRADERPASRCPVLKTNDQLAHARAANALAFLLRANGGLDQDWGQRIVETRTELPAGCTAGDEPCLSRQRSSRLSLHLGPALSLDPSCPWWIPADAG